MPLAWQLVPAALLFGVGLYATRFAFLGVGGHHGEPQEHFEAGAARNAFLGVGGHHGNPDEHLDSRMENCFSLSDPEDCPLPGAYDAELVQQRVATRWENQARLFR